ncbi:MAG: UDP-N-acetylglucosamine 2-epimerase (non-hydrolyzing) [Melioribacteraceae bacterium]|nr:UDP-N-acetylglucosamine 2-epimerase (non-hydrolyzing) [Melioribacteraceae bacterium]
MKKIISVVGARPNFMKVAPLHKAFANYNSVNGNSIQHLICHTGQHYDEKMSKVFFDDLELPKPDFYLGIGSGSHAEQTARVMIEFEKILLSEKPDLIIVVGDVNSTIACSLTAVKLGIKVAHVEAGLRSGDRAMPEEINRILTDSISDLLFVTEISGMENLRHEGVPEEKIHFVGNCMIDSLIHYLPKIEQSNIHSELSINDAKYVVATFHRPSNVDNHEQLKEMNSLLNFVAEEKNLKIVFPAHPRTIKNLEAAGLLGGLSKNIILTDPIGYLDFIKLVKDAKFILTDSGGIQEESTYLKVPCITIRTTTERPSTVDIGSNYLIGDRFTDAIPVIEIIMKGENKKGNIPELWDGSAADRIVKIINKSHVS